MLDIPILLGLSLNLCGDVKLTITAYGYPHSKTTDVKKKSGRGGVQYYCSKHSNCTSLQLLTGTAYRDRNYHQRVIQVPHPTIQKHTRSIVSLGFNKLYVYECVHMLSLSLTHTHIYRICQVKK